MTRRTLLFAALYASEGAPIGFVWWALPSLLRAADVPIERITALTAVLVLPWALKFAWAPVVDAWRGPRWGFRAWIVTAQLLMGGALVPLAWLDPVTHFDAWRLLLLAHAVAAATQDVAIDALAINTTPPADRGLLNGAMQAGMLAGRSAFGGGALLLAAWAGTTAVVLALIAWIWIALAAAVAVGRDADAGRQAAGPGLRPLLARALRRRETWWGLAFAATAGAAFESTGQLAGPFLVDRGVPQDTIGVFFGAVVVTAMLGGGLAGGWIADRAGHARAAGAFLAALALVVMALGAADASGAGTPARLALLAAMYVCVGLFTASSYALFMNLTDPRLGATQFSAFMSATNLNESWSALAGGRIAAGAGYPAAFATMAVVSLASLPILGLLRRRTAAPAHPPD